MPFKIFESFSAHEGLFNPMTHGTAVGPLLPWGAPPTRASGHRLQVSGFGSRNQPTQTPKLRVLRPTFPPQPPQLAIRKALFTLTS